MKQILEIFAAPGWTNLMIALLHSLWIGVIWSVVLGISLRFIRSSQTRYAAGLVAMSGLLLSIFASLAIISKPWISTVQAADTFTGIASEPNATLASPAQQMPEPAATVPTTPPINWTALAAAGWLTGICVMLLRLVTALTGAAQIRRESAPVSNSAILGILDDLRQSLGINRLIHLAESARVSAPCVCGIIAPTVLFPVSLLTGMPPEQIRAILAHELAHIRRHDFLINILQQIIESLLFFNPAVWWINRQIRLERETCCDQIAVQAITSREMYARTLVEFAERSISPDTALQPAFPGERSPSSLLERTRRLLLPEYRPLVRLPWHSLIAVLVLSGILLSVVWQGSRWAVVIAAEILTPEQRIEKIAELTANEIERSTHGDEHKIHISGRIRTEDGRPVTKGVQIHAVSERGDSFNHGLSWHSLNMKDGLFGGTLPYGKISLAAFGLEGYGPAFLNGLLPKPGNSIANLEVVLPKGFTAGIKLVDQANLPVAGAEIAGTYDHVGGSVLIKLVTDPYGNATLSNCVDAPLTLRAHASGFQAAVREDVRLAAKEPLLWTLKPSRLTLGKVIARGTRQPVPNATLKLLYRGPQMQINNGSFEHAPVLKRTDAAGEFRLDSLADGTGHALGIEAPGFAPKVAKNVVAGQTGIVVELGPELTIEGEIRGDLSQLLRVPEPMIQVANPIELSKHHTRSFGRSATVRIEGGVGRFSAAGLMEGTVELVAGAKSTILDLRASRSDLVITLDPPLTNRPSSSARTVIVQFQTPLNAPPTRGVLAVRNWSAADGIGTNYFVSITNGLAKFEARCPGWISWETKGLIGYWIPDQEALPIEPGPALMLVEPKGIPAGAIHGKVLGVDGNEISGVMISVIEAKRSAARGELGGLGDVGKNSASSNDGPTRFVVQPLPLGGDYALVARRGDQICASEIVSLDEAKPIQEVTLRFVEGKRLMGTVTDETGAPLRAVTVKSGYATFYSHGFGAHNVVTDAEGRFVLENINTSLPGHFEITVDDQPGFQPVRRKIVNMDEPMVIRLQPGLRVSGVVLHAETGNPLAGAEVYALPAFDSTGFENGFLNADSKTGLEGRFTFTTLAARGYVLHCRSGEITNPTFKDGPMGVQCVAGEKKDVVIRIKPHQGTRLVEGKQVISN
jgi:beta-lactamase regulating signal transducer with metallopeptidase domain